MSANAKILFIGLDSAEPELLKSWSDAGDLPVLRSLRGRGLWGDVPNVPGFAQGVFWPSFFTGLNPGRHGCYFLYQIMRGTYRLRRVSEETDLAGEPFWAALDRQGQKVAVVDMANAPLTSGLKGIQVANWTVHRRVTPPCSWPDGLMAEVIGRYGDDPFLGRAEYRGHAPADLVDLREGMLAKIDAKTRMCCDRLREGGWDMFAAVYGEPHDVGHICWHLHDPSHPLHDPAVAASVGNPLKDVYVALDGAIGRVIEAAGPDARVFVLAGPGMHANYTANGMLQEILQRIEVGPGLKAGGVVQTIKTVYRRSMPAALRKRVQKVSSRTGISLDLGERARRKCFALPNANNSGAIRLNVVGREPDGRIERGAAYEAYCDTLAGHLLDIVNLETGSPLIDEVVRVADACHGDRLDDLPDLLAVWNGSGPIRRVGSPRIGELRSRDADRRSGDHSLRGALLAAGPGIGQGALPQRVDLMAVAPTIAALLGVAMTDADGAPIPEICAQAARAPAPPEPSR